MSLRLPNACLRQIPKVHDPAPVRVKETGFNFPDSLSSRSLIDSTTIRQTLRITNITLHIHAPSFQHPRLGQYAVHIVQVLQLDITVHSPPAVLLAHTTA